MEIPFKEENTLKTFNTAKKFAEDILFPLMADFKKFQKMANFGAKTIEESIELNEELRDIQRFNGLKGMAETTYDLLISIHSTVLLHNNKNEIAKLRELLENCEKIKKIFYEHRDLFFETVYKDAAIIETLNRDYFEIIKKSIEYIYINTEILMTRNKLLFADSNEDYLTDEEIKEMIKKEYIEN